VGAAKTSNDASSSHPAARAPVVSSEPLTLRLELSRTCSALPCPHRLKNIRQTKASVILKAPYIQDFPPHLISFHGCACIQWKTARVVCSISSLVNSEQRLNEVARHAWTNNAEVSSAWREQRWNGACGCGLTSHEPQSSLPTNIMLKLWLHCMQRTWSQILIRFHRSSAAVAASWPQLGHTRN
jgi:hypothetical protein